MARKSVTQIPIKMYSYFAVATLVLTAALAYFAQGNSSPLITPTKTLPAQSAGAWRLESGTPPAKPAAEAAAPTPASQPAQSGGWGDSGGSMGGGSGAGSIMPQTTMAASGLPADYLATLTPEERARLQSSLADAGVLSEADLERRNAEMQAASRIRSNTAGRRDDM